MSLPINIEHLLGATTVESERIEFKEGWNPDSIYRTICAFANDFDNIGGGYIVVGVEDWKGRAKRPVKGLEPEQLDAIQRQMIGLNNLIRPYYAPKLYIEEVDGKQILVLWIPGGNDRPYEVPEQVTTREKRYAYYIRRYASSIRAEGRDRQELLDISQQNPYDDQINPAASLNDLSALLVREYLVEVGSKLLEDVETLDPKLVFEQLDLVGGPQENLRPKNVALMLFCYTPEKFFPYTQIDIVVFPEGLKERPDLFVENPPIKGPVQYQIREALSFIRNQILREKVVKLQDRAEAVRRWNYPYDAIEEIIVNSLYHRSYREREPVEIRVQPRSIQVISYNGPDRSIRLEDLKRGIMRSRRYLNRRIGGFFKEMELSEGRGTGVPTVLRAMERNGSPAPIFDTDEARSYFFVELPIHPAFAEEKIELSDRDSFKDNKLIYNRKNDLNDRVNDRVSDRDNFESTGIQKSILKYTKIARTRFEILNYVGLKYHSDNYKRHIEPLIVRGLLRMTIPDKPNSKNQRYIAVD